MFDSTHLRRSSSRNFLISPVTSSSSDPDIPLSSGSKTRRKIDILNEKNLDFLHTTNFKLLSQIKKLNKLLAFLN
jgi:hypothetical protein